MRAIKRLTAMGVAATTLVLAACATAPQPFDYRPGDDLKPGPGLFSGKDGAFTIHGSPAPAETKPSSDENKTPPPPGD